MIVLENVTCTFVNAKLLLIRYVDEEIKENLIASL